MENLQIENKKLSERGKLYLTIYLVLLFVVILYVLGTFYFGCITPNQSALLNDSEQKSCGIAMFGYFFLFIMGIPFFIGGGFAVYHFGKWRENKANNIHQPSP